MVGIKGKSGRKPDPHGGQTRYKKLSFYIKEHKLGDKWIEDKYFLMFKKHYGSKWQQVVRQFMENDAIAFLEEHWTCQCSQLFYKNKKHWRQPKCYECGSYKSEAARRMHEGPR